MPVPPANQPPAEVLVYPLRFKRDYVIRTRLGLLIAIIIFCCFIGFSQFLMVEVYEVSDVVSKTRTGVNAMTGVFGYLVLQMIYMLIVTVNCFYLCKAKEETQTNITVVQETSFIETPTGQGQQASVGVPYTLEAVSPNPLDAVSPNPSEVVSSNPCGTANIIHVKETDVLVKREDSSATVSSDSSATVVSVLPPSETQVQIHREDFACRTDVTNPPLAASGVIVSVQPISRSEETMSAAGTASGEAKLDEIVERCKIEKSVSGMDSENKSSIAASVAFPPTQL